MRGEEGFEFGREPDCGELLSVSLCVCELIVLTVFEIVRTRAFRFDWRGATDESVVDVRTPCVVGRKVRESIPGIWRNGGYIWRMRKTP